ncbi:MAG TPA: HAD hydrolase family protein [Chitinophagaceae bacterium]|nr:HAD hydrolase family protein [Chitinophagaceae bacterium]HPH32506.1 HAD hydrolase family protein [Chitinophagaceae bacterium]
MSILSSFKKITTFVFDIDGVLTDGTVLVLPNEVQARRMHIKDGFALQMALKNGYRVKIISGGNSPEVLDRLTKLGVSDVHMSVLDKGTLLQDWMKAENLKKEQVLYMGDDLPDLPALGVVGLPACPADAADEVKKISLYISPLKGGDACVREVIEKVLRLNGHWEYRVDVASR